MTDEQSFAANKPERAAGEPTSLVTRRSILSPRRLVTLSPSHLVLLFGLGLIVIAPLLQPGYFWGAHDARHDVYFLFEYDRAVQDGIWLPRWAPDFTSGYGYPFFIVYGPLATFISELFFRFGGLGYEDSVKAVLILSILLSGLAMYGFVRSWLGRNAGLVAATVYMALPYHLVDVYVRAALAESVALAFLPLALWGFRETLIRPRLAAVLGAAAAYAAIMWTSNLVAVVFTPGLAVYLLALAFWRARKGGAGQEHAGDATPAASRPDGRTAFLPRLPAIFLAPALAVVLGLGLSAAFFVPALVEQRYINQAQWFGQYYDPANHFLYFHQLFHPAWGFGISYPGPDDAAQGGMSFQLGAVPVWLTLIALAVGPRFDAARRRELWFWGAWGAVSVFLTLGVSAPVWRVAPIIPYAQFPWRYLMLALLPLSILPASLVADGGRGKAEGSLARPALLGRAGQLLRFDAFLLCALILVGGLPYLKAEMRAPTPEQGPVSFAALMRFQRSADEMTGVTAWVDPERRPRWSPMAELWVSGKQVTTWVDYSRVPQNETLAVNSEHVGSAHEEVWYFAAKEGQSIVFNRFWYPGWTAYLLDGRRGKPLRQLPIEREDGPLARVVVPVPAGEGVILLRLEDTPLRTAAKRITVGALGLAGLAVLISLARRPRRVGSELPAFSSES